MAEIERQMTGLRVDSRAGERNARQIGALEEHVVIDALGPEHGRDAVVARERLTDVEFERTVLRDRRFGEHSRTAH